ncbi:alkene reductase [Caballeronia mineralivorans]|jgi:N-ethylmaleimide reductase|uniref:alkene reductase n=1 Tax=Caballeronia mineralivorans TaxID=2010198 RepID=UPI002AFF043A|nr:alkene reductase [Caballeronia mineralivorans]MEA3099294.1 N-ethylmaleimide reductase [Caballeronia mineralivorans]
MSKLFSPIRVGAIDLSHRVVLAPLTRMRAALPGNVPNDLMATYYGQRASEGGLLISEATFISATGNGGYASPGIVTDAQVAGWRKVVDAVHVKGASIVLQLWHVGRQSHVALQPDGQAPVAPSAIQADVRALLPSGPVTGSMPRAIKLSEIPGLVGEYRRAAERAKEAGFDGVEIHGANGYLIDQFLQDNSNRREDAYGGSVENRTRFLLDVVEVVKAVWGGDRVGVRVGPGNRFGGMGDSAPEVTFPYVARALAPFGLAYLHVIEPRVTGNVSDDNKPPVAAGLLRPLFGGAVIAAGGFDGAGAESILEKGDADLVAFGRHFLANPDFPERLRHSLPLNSYDRTTFYYGGDKGYADYPVNES